MINKKFGKWTVKSFSHYIPYKGNFWNCVCSCGTHRVVGQYRLKNNKSLSCGCSRKETLSKMFSLDLAGKKFGRLTVIKKSNRPAHLKNSCIYWRCKCTCGKYIISSSVNLNNGHRKSCGCYRKEFSKKKATTHGLSKTDTYRTWAKIKNRIYNKKDEPYKYYGGRGIKLCRRWHKFENFFEDMGNRPSKKHSIERINCNGNYTPRNCKWALKIEQANNTRKTKKVVYKSKLISLHALSILTKIPHRLLYTRIFSRNWPVEKAISKNFAPVPKRPARE